MWTLPIEFICYVGLLIAFKLNLLRKKIVNILWIFAIVIFVLINYGNVNALNNIRFYVYPLYMFFVGIVFYCNRNEIQICKKSVLLGTVFFVTMIFIGLVDLAMIVFFPYVFIGIIYMVDKFPESLGNCGNYSYEIYLVAFPIQQSLVYLFNGEMLTSLNIIISIPISIVMGICLKIITDKIMCRLERR